MALILLAVLALACLGESALALSPDERLITSRVELANRCVRIEPQPGEQLDPIRVYLEPTGFGTYLLYARDRTFLTVDGEGNVSRASGPGRRAEWAIEHRDD